VNSSSVRTSRPRRSRAWAERAGLDSDALAPAAIARLGEQEADPAADVEDAVAGRGVALDPLQDAAKAGALARLLLDVVVGLGLGIRRVQLGLGGKPVELHMGAFRAPHDVAQRRPELLRGRDQPLVPHLTAHPQVLDQPG
jgi:hypothetical protein